MTFWAIDGQVEDAMLVHLAYEVGGQCHSNCLLANDFVSRLSLHKGQFHNIGIIGKFKPSKKVTVPPGLRQFLGGLLADTIFYEGRTDA